MNLPLPDEQIARLLAYLALMLKWNKTYSLTAITQPERMVSHHLLDSLAALTPIAGHRPVRILDVGSGGGQPGIPLAIVRPDWQLTLLDSNNKKAAFLQQAVIELGLKNVTVVCNRVEAVQGQAFDLITSRAFADLGDFVKLTRQLLTADGAWAALKGVQPFEEVAALPADISSTIEPLNVPGLGAERCIVWMRAKA
ncbi:16S rRNA (guanine(527)-N(7))-methyltransferase RsmG [Chitinimonas sp. BJYL2]|uniref:16S rRNA (guanine(527)-N(7))-methyltransferase RsmG n=1 Tax=Chitinimonas sp. BJYL2 TaxID=2976696 RepID=UPI0027E4247F|nr:16S rRNA (guanine(527)-N(7))-methyltransferase RsmG [Chitinimonas sp. BJYL2]